MPTIINPYGNQKTMGDDLFGLGGVADAFFGPKASTAAYTREKFREQQRQNLGVEELATLLQDPNAAPGSLAAAAARGGVTGTNLGQYNQFGVVGRAPDIRDPSVARSVLQAGGNYATTPVAFDQNLQKSYDIAQMQSERAAASQEAIANRTLVPTMTPAGPVYTRSIDAPGQRPVLTMPQEQGIQFGQNFPTGFAGLNPAQRLGIGVEPKGDDTYNWIYQDPTGQTITGTTRDARTDLLSGQPLPQGHVLHKPGAGAGLAATGSGLGKTQAGNLDENIIAGEDAIRLTKQVIQMAQTNPQIVGPSGNVLRAGQTATDLVASVQGLLGGREKADIDLTRARQTVMQTLGPNAAQIFPELFSGDLSQIETLHGLLTYKVARALNKGGTLSNMDVEKARTMIGDPTAWTQGPTGFLQKMAATQQQLELELADNLKRRQTNRASIGPMLAPPGATAAPGIAAPPPPPGFVPD